MKIKILLLALLAFAICSCSGKVESDIAQHQLQGKVNYIHYRMYEASLTDGKVIKGNEINNKNVKISFNANGAYEKVTVYNKDGEITSDKAYTYNGDGTLAFIVEYRFRNGVETDNTLTKYEYKEGRLDNISDKVFKTGEPLSFKKYNYNGEHISKIETFDKDNNLIESVEFKAYDSDNATETLYSNNAYEILSKITYQDGYWVNMLIERTDEDGTNKLTVKRNKDGLPVKSSQCSFTVGEEYVFSPYYLGYKYEYDQNGNWIRRITTDITTDTPISITERNIEYYNL